jgi:hypothetical protein
MLMPLEGRSETASDDADTNFLRVGVDRYRSLRERYSSRKGETAMLEKIASRAENV